MSMIGYDAVEKHERLPDEPWPHEEPLDESGPPQNELWWQNKENERRKDMSHTPGPWNLTGASFGHSIGANGIRIAQTANIVHEGSEGVHEEKANARLIAAAPDLLDACKALLSAMKTAPGHYLPDLAQSPLPFEYATDDIRQAVEKAKGE